jgi:hypothetical protein
VTSTPSVYPTVESTPAQAPAAQAPIVPAAQAINPYSTPPVKSEVTFAGAGLSTAALFAPVPLGPTDTVATSSFSPALPAAPAYEPFGSAPRANSGAGYAPFLPTTGHAVPKSQDQPSAQTGAIWIFAFMPVLAAAALTALYMFVPAVLEIPRFAILGVIALFYVLVAALDGSALKRKGHSRIPSALTALVPLVYLAIRTGRLGRRSAGPLVVWLLIQLAAVAVAVLTVLPLIMSLLSSGL